MVERTYLPGGDAALVTDAALVNDAGPSQARYGTYVPRSELRDAIECIQLGDEFIPAEAPLVERVLPDGAVHLEFNFAEVPVVVEGGNEEQGRAGGSVAGASLAPAVIRMQGHVQGVGVRLRAGGAAALLGLPAGEVRNRRVTIEGLWGGAGPNFWEQLAAVPHGATRAALLERLLLARLTRIAAPASPLAPAAVRLIHASGGRVRIRDLAATLGVGERRLEQVFYLHVGITPKAACRLARFHASVRRVRRVRADLGADWSAIAYEFGFTDQAHLIHEYRALAGLAPGELQRRVRFGFLQDVIARHG